MLAVRAREMIERDRMGTGGGVSVGCELGRVETETEGWMATNPRYRSRRQTRRWCLRVVVSERNRQTLYCFESPMYVPFA